MSWDISIIKDPLNKEIPLGPREDVIARFAHAIPSIALSEMPCPGQEILALMPEFTRQWALSPKLVAEYHVGDLYIYFYCRDESTISWVSAEVRGNESPLPILAAICVPNSWCVVDLGNNTTVDLSASTDMQWDRFCAWRNSAFSSRDEKINE